MAALHVRMGVWGAAGATAGVLGHHLAGDAEWLTALVRYASQPVGQVFLRLLQMLVVPLAFAALALGVADVGDLRRFGRIGLRTLVYTVVVSFIAVLIGLTLVNVLRPGDGLDPAARALLTDGLAERAQAYTGGKPPTAGLDLLVMLVPSNPLEAAATGNILAWMTFSLFIGVGLLLVDTPGTQRFRETLTGLYEICMRLLQAILRIAPYGVAALLFTLTAQLGVEALVPLGKYVGVVLLALGLHQFGVYSLAVRFLGGMSPRVFFREIQEAMLTAFSTASSNATLPTALRVAEERLKLPPAISRFVLTIGATANQNGTALFEGVTVLFLAQFFGRDLSLTQQFTVLVVCVLAGIGTAGVPAGSLPVIAMILKMVDVPVEGIGIILGVDRFLDMCRTTLNVTGDLAAAVVISRGQPVHPLEMPPEKPAP
jgi:DAACS family dicarboxylate/amino acid:cation (Na+ or H+) symporter